MKKRSLFSLKGRAPKLSKLESLISPYFKKGKFGLFAVLD
jgi:hypothetical protein